MAEVKIEYYVVKTWDDDTTDDGTHKEITLTNEMLKDIIEEYGEVDPLEEHVDPNNIYIV